MKASLYELTGQYKRLMELAFGDDESEPVGLTSPMLEVLSEIEDDIDAKLIGCVKALKSMNAAKAAIDAERAALKERSERLEQHHDELKAYVKDCLDRLGLKKRIAGPFTLSVCNNSQESVTVLNLDAVPREFDKVHPREVSLTAIKTAFKAGREVPGVLIERGTHLRVK